MKLPYQVKDKLTQRVFEYISARLPNIACGWVVGSGGSTYSLQTKFRDATVAGQATGVCRVTLPRDRANTSAVWPFVLTNDNGGWASGGIVIAVNPVTVDFYISNSITGALTNRSFFYLILWS